MTKKEKDYDILLETASFGTSFLLDLAGEATASLIPGGYGIYSALKQKRVKENMDEAIKEISKRSNRIEEQIKTLTDKEKYGELTIEYLELMGEDPEKEKIKYFIESLITNMEAQHLRVQKNMYLSTIKSLTIDEIRYLYKAYIDFTKYKKQSVARHIFLGPLGQLTLIGIYERLRSHGLLKVGAIDLDGNPINFIPSEWGFNFCRHLESDEIEKDLEEELKTLR
ncbi:hypothetical protein [Pontibacillus salipaludis]|uniref:hypothetical protein n=1 Tax=Pontibacillus salipaludis TaxID=1697394 RepID=UPI0031E77929